MDKGKVELGHVFDIHILKIKMKRVSQCIHFEEIYTLKTVTISPGFLFSGSHNSSFDHALKGFSLHHLKTMALLHLPAKKRCQT
jgi:hypothetical protein